MRSGFKGYPPNTRRLDQPGPRTAPPFNSFNLTGINAMKKSPKVKLDIELNEDEIHVTRLALEAYWVSPYKHGENTETLHTLRLRFEDLAQVKRPTP